MNLYLFMVIVFNKPIEAKSTISTFFCRDALHSAGSRYLINPFARAFKYSSCTKVTNVHFFNCTKRHRRGMPSSSNAIMILQVD